MIDRSILPQAVVRLRKRRADHGFLNHLNAIKRAEQKSTPAFPPVIEQANPGHMTTLADGWIEWKGGEKPVADDVPFFIKLADGSVGIVPARDDRSSWNMPVMEAADADIVAYKVAA